jgi:steroid delta-isomerase-like uncharacterized protein
MGSDADVVRRLTDEVFIGGNVGRIDELVGDDFVSHDPPPGFAATKAGLRELATHVGQAFADRKIEFDDFVDTTDGRVVESWAMVGTHTGEFFGLPASGQSVRIRGIEIWRCANGKVVENWGAVDMGELFAAAAGGPTT